MNRHPKVRAQLLTENDTSLTQQQLGRTYYGVKLWMEDLPDDTYAVTYILHPTYYERVNEVRKKPLFPLWIWTYGDFEVQATISRKDGIGAAAVWISDALRESHPNPSPAVNNAIATIAAN